MPQPPKKKARSASATADTIYLAPGEPLPQPRPGVSQVIVKQEVWAVKVESNTADDPVDLDTTEEEMLPPSQPPAQPPFPQYPTFTDDLDYYSSQNVVQPSSTTQQDLHQPSTSGTQRRRKRGQSYRPPALDPQTERYGFDDITTNRTDRPLNPVCRELYLNSEDFRTVFGMSKQEFYSLKLWRQRELKKMMGLF